MHEEMQEYKIILTWEAIYDVTDIADYIQSVESGIKQIILKKNSASNVLTVFNLI